MAVGSGEEGSVETNFGVRSRPIRWLYLATREVYWRVMSVEPEEARSRETFCAVVPGNHTFTLAGGVYTGNCGACEPECPVEAIFPEDALPDKWEPFVKINYAFDQGLDVINGLVDAYATEHNVQNPRSKADARRPAPTSPPWVGSSVHPPPTASVARRFVPVRAAFEPIWRTLVP